MEIIKSTSLLDVPSTQVLYKIYLPLLYLISSSVYHSSVLCSIMNKSAKWSYDKDISPFVDRISHFPNSQ